MKTTFSLFLMTLAACGTGAVVTTASAANVVRAVAQQAPQDANVPATPAAQDTNVYYANPWPNTGTVQCALDSNGITATYVVTLSAADIHVDLTMSDASAQVTGHAEADYQTDSIDSNLGLVAAASMFWKMPTPTSGLRNLAWVAAVDPATYVMSAACGGEWAALTGHCGPVLQSQCTYTP